MPIVVANYERLFSIKKRRFESGKVKIRGFIVHVTLLTDSTGSNTYEGFKCRRR